MMDDDGFSFSAGDALIGKALPFARMRTDELTSYIDRCSRSILCPVLPIPNSNHVNNDDIQQIVK